MSASPDVLRRLHKLLALARRGEGGEKENAERMLAATMAKFGVGIEDLDDAVVSRCTFKIPTTADERVLVQVLCKVLNVRTLSWFRGFKRADVELTKAQHVEVEFLYGLYRRQWRAEEARLFQAFVAKHSLGSDQPREENAEPLSPEELARIRSMMRGLEDVPLHKRLEAATGGSP